MQIGEQQEVLGGFICPGLEHTFPIVFIARSCVVRLPQVRRLRGYGRWRGALSTYFRSSSPIGLIGPVAASFLLAALLTMQLSARPVSYTHLTLPTILRV